MDWFGVSILIFSTTLLGSYYELKGYPTHFIVFNIINLILGLLNCGISYKSLQKVFYCSDIKNKSKNKSNNKNDSLLNIFILLDTYIFRILVCIFYALGLIIAWIHGCLLRGEANNHIWYSKYLNIYTYKIIIYYFFPGVS